MRLADLRHCFKMQIKDFSQDKPWQITKKLTQHLSRTKLHQRKD